MKCSQNYLVRKFKQDTGLDAKMNLEAYQNWLEEKVMNNFDEEINLSKQDDITKVKRNDLIG